MNSSPSPSASSSASSSLASMPTSQPMSSVQAGAVLSAAIGEKALPWIEDSAENCVVIARPNFKAMTSAQSTLPEGVEVSMRRIQSRRVVVRNRPEGFQFVSARWPADGLETKRFPMIGCTLRGSAELRISNYLVHSKEGRFIFFPPGIPHPDASRIHLEGDNQNTRSCDLLWFSIVGEVLRCWICRSENGQHASFPTLYFDSKKLSGYCEELFEDLEGESAYSCKIRQGLLITLMSSVQKEIEAGRYFRWLPQSVALSPEEHADPIKRAQNYVRQHLSEPLTLERLARHTFMSRSQFARKFHDETGETFIEFVNRCRIEEAKLRLATTEAQIAGLSRHVGLKPRRFMQLFRQQTGLTPGAYRNQHNPHVGRRGQALADS